MASNQLGLYDSNQLGCMKVPFLGRGGREKRREKRREEKGIKDFDRRTFWGVWS
jgi:hypothetical protein